MRRNSRDEWSEKQRAQKAQCRYDGGKAGTTASFNSGCALDECTRSGRSYERGKCRRESIRHHRTFDLWKVAVLIKEAGAGGDPDERAHGIHKRDHEDCQNDGEEAPIKNA